MEILKNIEVPTGNILIVEGAKGKLECLSIGDYGKDVNLKCDAIGLDRVPDAVKHQQMLPLEDKWVITISTQYGCSMNCTFCDVPKVGAGKNATVEDLVNQVFVAMKLHPEVTESDRVNIHYARMGEPTWNKDVLLSALRLNEMLPPLGFRIHPVVSTMMPKKNKNLFNFLNSWMLIKNDRLSGEAGLQLSINSTSDEERYEMFSGNSLPLEEISKMMEQMPKPKGRKITLNFALADFEIDPLKLYLLFNPDNFIVKLTPMHLTSTAMDNKLYTAGNTTMYYPYKDVEETLKSVGFDVLVFLPSKEEDDSRITCGNAILSGSLPTCEYKEIK